MKHLYFVRHGQSVMNLQGVWSGLTDTPLTDTGREQAHQAGQQLRAAGIDRIVSSPIRRARDTADIIAAETGLDPAEIITNDLFIERDFGPLEGTAYRPHAVTLNELEGVEHSDDLVKRVAEGLEFLRTLDADTILVVSHGAVGRALRSLTEDDTTFHSSHKFENAQVVKLL